LHRDLYFFIILETSFKSFLVLLIITRFAPASARAIEQARPKPFPAPDTIAVLFFKLYFLKTFIIKF